MNLVDAQESNVSLTCNCERLELDLDTVTALGIVVAELVSNSYEHAFPAGEGSIGVSLRGATDAAGMATLIVTSGDVVARRWRRSAWCVAVWSCIAPRRCNIQGVCRDVAGQGRQRGRRHVHP
jgi:hypothetical protein